MPLLAAIVSGSVDRPNGRSRIARGIFAFVGRMVFKPYGNLTNKDYSLDRFDFKAVELCDAKLLGCDPTAYDQRGFLVVAGELKIGSRKFVLCNICSGLQHHWCGTNDRLELPTTGTLIY